MRMLLLLLAAPGLLAARAHTPSNVCVDVDDCASPEPCHEVACVTDTSVAYAGMCVYTRVNASTCCLTHDECCELAAPNERGYCLKDCTCGGECMFVRDRQCTADSDCDAFLSALVCRAQGPCFYPSCEHGDCECINGTGADLDNDGVPCPEDCNDHDATISRPVTCLRDADNDYFPACPPPSGGGAYPPCLDFCVEPNHTCPYGYTDVTDVDRRDRPRSLRADTGVPCNGSLAEDDPACDCCDIDARAHPGSMYTSSRANNCHEADYDCSGSTELFACCLDGSVDTHAAPGGPRHLWFTSACLNATAPDVCGGCSTLAGGMPLLALGWACEEAGECGATPNVSTVAPGACPSACANECACVEAAARPVTGQCAKFVSSCTEVRDDLYSDHEQCCVATVA